MSPALAFELEPVPFAVDSAVNDHASLWTRMRPVAPRQAATRVSAWRLFSWYDMADRRRIRLACSLAGHPACSSTTSGSQQAADTAARIGVLPIAAVVSSPLERCLQTADAVAAALDPALGRSRPTSG